MSATVDSSKLAAQLRNKYAISIGILMQFIIMPLLGFVALKAVGDRISEAMGMVLLVVTSSPGGSYSNWWCSLFNADLALSVAMTALSTLLSTLFLPVNLLLYSHFAFGRSQESILNSMNWSTLFVSLAIVICAIVSGLIASNYFKTKLFRQWANRLGSASGLSLVVFSAVMNALAEKDEDGNSNKLFNQNWAFYVGVTFPCIVGLLLSNLFSYIAHLNASERVTLSVECCYQNVGIATSMAVSMFDDNMQRAEALCVPLFYGLVEAIILAIYCLIAWKQGWTKAPKDEKVCTMLVNSYEFIDDDDDTTYDTEDEEVNRAMDGTPSLSVLAKEQLQDMNMSSLTKSIHKLRGNSVDTHLSSCSTTSSTVSDSSTGKDESIVSDICSPTPLNGRIPQNENSSTARRRSPFLSTRKELQF